MSKYAIIGFYFLVIVVIGYFGSGYGYTVNGVTGNTTTNITAGMPTQPDDTNFVAWSWEAVKFLFNFATFQIVGIPLLFSAFFWVLNIMVGLVIIGIIRGTD